MAKFTKDKDGKETFEMDDDDRVAVELGARTRVRARELDEERLTAREAEKKCEKCGEAKHDGECKKKKKDGDKSRRFLG